MRRSTVILCVVLALIPVVFCAVAVPVALVIRGIDKDEDRIDQKASGNKAPALMTHAEFDAKVKGRSEAELIALIGEPNDKMDRKEGSGKIWIYFDRTTNEITGKPDKWASAIVVDGRVTGTGYSR